MKFVNRSIFVLIVFCLAMAAFFTISASPSAADLNKVTVEFGQQATKSGVAEWLSKNWSLVALAVSEVAAFLPSKASGILHAVTRSAVKIARVLVQRK